MESGPVPTKPGELWLVEFEKGVRAVVMTLRRDRVKKRWVSWSCAVTMIPNDTADWSIAWYREELGVAPVLDWPSHRWTKLSGT